MDAPLMRFDLTRPCSNCPFRSDRPFHLHPDRVREILGDERCDVDAQQSAPSSIIGMVREQLRVGKWWPAASFPCHKTIIYTDDDGTIVPDSAQQCAGVMAILHRENKPNQAMQLAERFGLWHPSQLDQRAPFYTSTQAAIEGQFAKRKKQTR
jgi:hypothetical protein